FKCMFFVLAVIVGAALAFLVHLLPSAGVFHYEGTAFNYSEAVAAAVAAGIFIIAPLVALIAKCTIPVCGTLFCASVGYIYAFLGNVLTEVRGQIFLALIVTVALFAALMLAYVSGKININKKLSSVIRVLFATLVISTILLSAAYFIPSLNQAAVFVMSNPIVSIGLSALGIVLVSLFLLNDFKAVTEAVEYKLPKKYEWVGAFGIVFSVIWLFIEVFGFITRVQDIR
ncbi:MAG: Bax inhibitor-1/YccA family protein, partial [Acutalibacteraceae bacterium]